MERSERGIVKAGRYEKNREARDCRNMLVGRGDHGKAQSMYLRVQLAAAHPQSDNRMVGWR